MNYHEALTESMAKLAQRPNTIFLGQGVVYNSTTMSSTFRDVPPAQRLEMPVAEEMQMGMCIGMALQGYLPICVFPRWNFALRAADQIINHLDRLPLYSDGGYKPKVIIRIAAPSVTPFNPGPQHDDDFMHAFALMCRTIKFFNPLTADEVLSMYAAAADWPQSCIVSERTEYYKNARGEA